MSDIQLKINRCVGKDALNKISEIENVAIEIILNETQKEKEQLNKNEQTVRDLGQL